MQTARNHFVSTTLAGAKGPTHGPQLLLGPESLTGDMGVQGRGMMTLLFLLPSRKEMILTYNSGTKKLAHLHFHSMAINRNLIYISSQTGAIFLIHYAVGHSLFILTRLVWFFPFDYLVYASSPPIIHSLSLDLKFIKHVRTFE